MFFPFLKLLERHKQNSIQVNVSFTNVGLFLRIVLIESMTTTEKEFIVVFDSMSGRINTAATATVTSKDKTKPLLEDAKKVRLIVKDESRCNL